VFIFGDVVIVFYSKKGMPCHTIVTSPSSLNLMTAAVYETFTGQTC